MDNFIVSARKYRPQTFDTVVGQSHITTTLKNAIKNHQLAHAFLFCGPRGVGKTTCARILAKTINCENIQPDGEACNACTSCKSFNEGIPLNIHELDAASNNSVDDIRTLVEQVRFAPQAGKYKIYIVDEVHMLSASAFNAFLKTLEEPPNYAIFILATTEKHKILPTILSRCQIFDFKRITNNDTVEHLEDIANKEHIDAQKAALQIIAQKSEGCMRDALSILDKIVSFTNGEVTYQNTLEHLNILDEDYYFKLLDSLLKQDLAAALLLFDEINRKGFEGDIVLNGFAEFMRNLMVSKDAKAAPLLDVMEGMQSKYAEIAKQVSLSFLVSSLNILNDAEINYKMARNKRLHVEMTLIKINFLQQALELTTENNAVVKKKRIDGPVAYRIKNLDIQKQAAPQDVKAAPVNIVSKTTEAKLVIQPERPTAKTIPIQKEVSTTIKNKSEAPVINIATNAPLLNGGGRRTSLLDALKNKYGSEYDIKPVENPIPLNDEKLLQEWNTYTESLVAQQKYSPAGVFRTAQLRIEDENTFVITVSALTQQRFIEQERMMLSEHLQTEFNNRSLSFRRALEEVTGEIAPVQTVLNSRQRYEKLAAMYPLIKELKERLKLEIN